MFPNRETINQVIHLINELPAIETPYNVTLNNNVTTLFYPLSGADVRAPLGLFPNAKTIVMIDSLIFLDDVKETEKNDPNHVFNSEFYKSIEQVVGENNIASIGRDGGSPTGYDFTSVYSLFRVYTGDALDFEGYNLKSNSSHDFSVPTTFTKQSFFSQPQASSIKNDEESNTEILVHRKKGG